MIKCAKIIRKKTNYLNRKKNLIDSNPLILFFLFTSFFSNAQLSYNTTQIVEENSISKKIIKITAVGDIMFGTNFPAKKYLPKNEDCIPLIENVKEFFNNSDIIFGNLEGCISDNAPPRKRCNDPTKCYLYRMPKKFSNCLNERRKSKKFSRLPFYSFKSF